MGLTASKTYQSHFWHVKEEYVWPDWVARYRRDMYLGHVAGRCWRGCLVREMPCLKDNCVIGVKDEVKAVSPARTKVLRSLTPVPTQPLLPVSFLGCRCRNVN